MSFFGLCSAEYMLSLFNVEFLMIQLFLVYVFLSFSTFFLVSLSNSLFINGLYYSLLLLHFAAIVL
jgi:hypothetical protein